MGLSDNFKKTDLRSLENLNAPVSADDFVPITGWSGLSTDGGVTVNVDNAIVKTK